MGCSEARWGSVALGGNGGEVLFDCLGPEGRGFIVRCLLRAIGKADALMRITQGQSARDDARQAVAEATEDWGEASPDLILLFNSTRQDPHIAALAMHERFPEAAIAGCTTAGELLNGAHFNDSLVALGMSSDKLRFCTESISLDDLSDQSLDDLVVAAFRSVGAERDEAIPSHVFALVFVDGLRMKEERLAAMLANSLVGVPVVGGSAGDDLKFNETLVYCGAEAKTNHATLVLCRSDLKYQVFKHQHFVNTDTAVVITKADPEQRLVLEIDGYPAAEAYARALGVEVEELEGDVTFLHPVTFSSHGQIYVRSIQSVNQDGSLAFYCAVETGMVLQIGGHHEMDTSLNEDLEAKLGKAEVLFASNCILRSLEAKSQQKFDALGAVLQKHSRHSIGFDTYGEQVDGLHVNQTLVGLALMSEQRA